MSSPRDVLQSFSPLSSTSGNGASSRGALPRGPAVRSSPPPAARPGERSRGRSRTVDPPAAPPPGPESLESRHGRGEKGFQELRALVALPFFENFDARAAKKLGQFFTRRVFEIGDIVRHTEPSLPAAEGAAAAGADSASSSSGSTPASSAAAAPGSPGSGEQPPEEAFHVLVRGRVELFSRDLDGKLVTLGQYSHPAYFGQQALVHSSAAARASGKKPKEDAATAARRGSSSLRPLKVVALEQCIVLSIGARRFEQFVAENPGVRVTLSIPADGNDLAFQGVRVGGPSQAAQGAASGGNGVSHVRPLSPLRPRDRAASMPEGSGGGPAHASSVASASGASGATTFAGSFGGGAGGPPPSSSSPWNGSNTAAEDKLRLIVSLRDLPFFRQLGQTIPETKLQQLAQLFDFRRAPEQTVLIREHDEPQGFYILISGRVSVSAMDLSTHQPMHLNTLTAGDAFGEISLLLKTLRTATVTTVQPCTLLYLSTAAFRSFVTLAPEVLSNGVWDGIIHRRIGNSLKILPMFSCLRLKEKGPYVSWKEDVLSALGSLFKYVFVPRGSVVCAEGDPADAFYIITRGSLECSSKAEASEAESFVGVPVTQREEGGQADILLTELGPADYFGELAMGAACPTRTATVRALTDCTLLRLPREHWDRFIALVPELQHTLDRVISMRTTQTLANIPFFRNVHENRPWSKLDLLGRIFKFEHFEAGDIVVREGEVGNKFFVICEGQVEVSKKVPSKKQQMKGGASRGVSPRRSAGCGASSGGPASRGTSPSPAGSPNRGPSPSPGSMRSEPEPAQEVILDILGRSSWFGELALLKETIRLATVRCRTPCLFLTVTKSQFDKVAGIAPDLVLAFSSLVTHRTANLLRSIPFFHQSITENKPWSKLELLCTLFQYEYFDAGVEVMREGEERDETNKLYVLSVGSVVATRRRRSGDPPSDPLPLLSPTSNSPGSPKPVVPPPSEFFLPGDSASADATVQAASSSSWPGSTRAASPTPGSASGSADALHLQVASPHVSRSPRSPRSPSTLELPAGAVGQDWSTAVAPVASGAPGADDEALIYRQILERGSCVGGEALLRSVPRAQTLRTLEPCVFFTLTRERFQNFTKVCPELLESVKKRFSDEQHYGVPIAASNPPPPMPLPPPIPPRPSSVSHAAPRAPQAPLSPSRGRVGQAPPIPPRVNLPPPLTSAAPVPPGKVSSPSHAKPLTPRAPGSVQSPAANASQTPPSTGSSCDSASVSSTSGADSSTSRTSRPVSATGVTPKVERTSFLETGAGSNSALAASATSSAAEVAAGSGSHSTGGAHPLRHSSSFSEPFTVPALAADADGSVHETQVELGHSVLIDAFAVHGHDGSVRHSRKNSATSPLSPKPPMSP